MLTLTENGPTGGQTKTWPAWRSFMSSCEDRIRAVKRSLKLGKAHWREPSSVGRPDAQRAQELAVSRTALYEWKNH